MSSPKVSLPAGSSYPDAEGMQFTACQGALLSNTLDTGQTKHLPLPLLAA